MADEIEEIKSAPFVIVPVDLVRSSASKNALLCFLSMGSFGPESRARVATIAKRMRVKEKQIVRDAQVELVDGGFIRLLKLESEHKPRQWVLWPFRDQQEETGGGKNRPAEIPAPKQTNSDKPDKGLLSHKFALGLFIRAWGDQASYKGQKYVPTGKDHANLKKLLQGEVEPILFAGKLEAYLQSTDPFDRTQRHSLSLFCSTFNKWPFIPAGSEAAAPRVNL